MKRAVLVFNPHATTTSPAVRDVIADRLASTFDLDLQPTKQRGHATHIVDGALDEGIDHVFALGGDGTVNEVIQAMAGTQAVLGAIPGGGTNVFARALGLPNDAAQATQQLVQAADRGAVRDISLGQVAGRWFCFHAGFGFDAAVIRGVEQAPKLKKLLRQAAFVGVAIKTLASDTQRHEATITIELPDGTTVGPGAMAIIGNTTPWTYLQDIEFHVTPQATFDSGLDITLLGAISTARLGQALVAAMRRTLQPDHDISMLHDLDGFVLTSPEPRPLQVDGDYAGEHSRVEVRHAAGALRVWDAASNP